MHKLFAFLRCFRVVLPLVLGAAIASLQSGCTDVSRNLAIDSTPSGAIVAVDGQRQGTTSFSSQKEIVWQKQGPQSTHSLDVTKDGYEPVHKDLGYLDAQASQNPWSLQFDLQPLMKTVDVVLQTMPPGATIRIPNLQPFTAPATIPITFTRPASDAPWSVAKATFSLPNYFPQSADIQLENVEKDPHVNVTLQQSERLMPVDIDANVDAAMVYVNATNVGTTPLRYNFDFTRPDPQSPWAAFLVAVKKDGYHVRVPDNQMEPGSNPQFSKLFTMNDAMQGQLKVDLDPITYIYSTVLTWDFSSKGLGVKQEEILSKTGEIEKEPKVQSVTRITDFKPEDGFIETRISVMPDGQGIIFAIGSIPNSDASGSSLSPSGDSNGHYYSNIWMQRGNARTRLTDGLQFDVEPCVSADGKTVFFSSDRLGSRYTIWSMQTLGRGGLTKVTDSSSTLRDTDPTISPDGTKIAYTCYLQGEEAAQIWTIRADGTLPTQVRLGRSPAWSSDGKKIAFVAPDDNGLDKIWVMDADGGNPTQLTTGDQLDEYPCWTPDGKSIVYASNQALNEEHQSNFDIWEMHADGTGITQLTVNGSYDTRPAVSPDGKYIYFISNRGAQVQGQNSLQIWRIELATQ